MAVDVTYDVVDANKHNPVVPAAVLVRSMLTRVLSELPSDSSALGVVCLFLGMSLAGASVTLPSVLETIPQLFATLLIVLGSALAAMALAFGHSKPVASDTRWSFILRDSV